MRAEDGCTTLIKYSVHENKIGKISMTKWITEQIKEIVSQVNQPMKAVWLERRNTHAAFTFKNSTIIRRRKNRASQIKRHVNRIIYHLLLPILPEILIQFRFHAGTNKSKWQSAHLFATHRQNRRDSIINWHRLNLQYSVSLWHLRSEKYRHTKRFINKIHTQ